MFNWDFIEICKVVQMLLIFESSSVWIKLKGDEAEDEFIIQGEVSVK